MVLFAPAFNAEDCVRSPEYCNSEIARLKGALRVVRRQRSLQVYLPMKPTGAATPFLAWVLMLFTKRRWIWG